MVMARRHDSAWPEESWTVRAGRYPQRDTIHEGAAYYVGPADRTRGVRVARPPDERYLASLILAQALRADPRQLMPFEEIKALGLGTGMIWA